MKRFLTFVTKISALRISLAIALIFLAAHVYQEFARSGGRSLLYRLELAALDTKFLARSAVKFTPHVIIAKLDEKTIENYGLPPLSRNLYGDLIDRLTEAGAKAIAFDVMFADEDRNNTYQELKRFKDVYDEAGLYRRNQPALLGSASEKVEKAKVQSQLLNQDERVKRKTGSLGTDLSAAATALETYEEKSQRFYDIMSSRVSNLSPDEALAAAIRRSRRVISTYFFFRNERELVGLAKTQLDSNFNRIKNSGSTDIFDSSVKRGGAFITRPIDGDNLIEHLNSKVSTAVAVLAPLPLIAEASEHFGYMNAEPDDDGRIRSSPLISRLRGVLFPSLDLAAATVYYGGSFSPLAQVDDPRDITGIAIDDPSNTSGYPTVLPTDFGGKMLINYYGDPTTLIPSASISDIIQKKTDLEQFKDKVVFVGETAIGTSDLRSTPFSPATPGVYTHAMLVQNIIDHRYLQRWPGFAFVEGLLLLLFGVLGGLVLPKVQIGWGLLGTLVIAFAMLLIDKLWIFESGLWMRPITPVMELFVIFLGITIYRYLTEEREKRVIRRAFQFYLTKSVVEAVLKDTSRLKLGGEKKELSVLFSDIRGFTTISERLTPEDLVHLLNNYLTPMTDIVFQHEGTLDKYMGDAIMAIFGAPVDQPDHATRACHAALDMMAKLRVLQEEWRQKGLPEVDIGIGLNSGPMAVGNMGSEMRFDYTVMGDNVNLGSRLEGINKEYGTNIIISEYTYNLAKNDVYVREIDAVRVKGKREPVRIFELRGMGRPGGQEEQMMAVFSQALTAYRSQLWEEAIALFTRCMEMWPSDYCSKKYIDRCTSMSADPPGEGWDGVYTMKTK